MTDEELKQKAEKTATKMLLILKKLLDDTEAEMTEDEKVKFTFYFLAAYGAIGNQLMQTDEGDGEQVDLHDYIDAMNNAYEMVYEEDQKPDWGS